MTTEKQIAANQQNAALSTGPKTKKGKEYSSKNAITHGLLANAVIMHGETINAFDRLQEEIFEDIKPEGAVEMLLTEKMVAYAWRLRRAIEAEAVMMQEGLTRQYNPKTLDSFFAGCLGTKMNNMSRYESMIAKHFYRAFRELNEIQKIRRSRESTEGTWIQ